jgi:hypothetical protein
MNRELHKIRSLCAALAAGAALGVAQADDIMSSTVYEAAHDQLKASYKAERAACDKLSANAREVCVRTAKGREKVALAHLRYQRSGDDEDLIKVVEARYEARFEVARQACNDQTGHARDLCVASAWAERDKARASARMTRDINQARGEVEDAKDRADYALARAHCDALSRQAKDACVASARARFGQ